MKIAVEGCAHGELEKIYSTIQGIEQMQNIKIDLLLCCGDFQATRNLEDLQTMAVPKKYLNMCTFYKYYSGELVAPILTIFIGGNHEASNYLQELPYGGWVAPKIYYLGYAGVVRLNGIRIAGLSGIFKGHDYNRGRHEYVPYTESTCRSVYHVRQLEVFRLKQLSGEIDIFISHDWPTGIYNYGNKAQLLRFKPHFRDGIEQNSLGSKPSEELLKALKPLQWFAAHMHCKFAAIVPHDEQQNGSDSRAARSTSDKITKFLALDKCLPQRRFLQVVHIEEANACNGDLCFEYDLEWLTILYLTNHLINVHDRRSYMPGPGSCSGERHNFTPTKEELESIRLKFANNLRIPENFCPTAAPYNPNNPMTAHVDQPKPLMNPQSSKFCTTLGIDDPLCLAMLIHGHQESHSFSVSSNKSGEKLIDCTLNAQPDCENMPLDHRSSRTVSLPSPKSGTSFVHQDECMITTSFAANISDVDMESDISVLTASDEQPVSDLSRAKPPFKKFKRRNQNIYDQDEDSGDCT